jgi:hypothetical protein
VGRKGFVSGPVIMAEDALGAWAGVVVRVVGEAIDDTWVLEDAPVAVVDVELPIAWYLILPEREFKKISFERTINLDYSTYHSPPARKIISKPILLGHIPLEINYLIKDHLVIPFQIRDLLLRPHQPADLR